MKKHILSSFLGWILCLLFVLPADAEDAWFFIWADFDGGPRRALNWASLDKEKITNGNRRLAAWTTNTHLQPIHIVKESGQTFIRADFAGGPTRELNWASLNKERITNGNRRLAAWTTNLGLQPVQIVERNNQTGSSGTVVGRR